jgi:hypothetical protein
MVGTAQVLGAVPAASRGVDQATSPVQALVVKGADAMVVADHQENGTLRSIEDMPVAGPL